MDSITTIPKTERNYGIDFLRIIAMLLVLLRHIVGTNDYLGNAVIYGGDNAINEMIAWFLETVAYICVNLYALISGYVGYGRKIRYGNIVYLCLSVMFYTIPFTCFQAFVLKVPTSARTWFSAFLPMLSGWYWYFIAYFVLFFFTPYLNILMENLRKKMPKLLFFP